MGNPRCKICGGTTQKWGSTRAGRPRFRCLACRASQSRRNDTRARHFSAFLDFVTGKYTLADYGPKGRTIRRRNEPFWHLWPVSPLVDEVHHVVFVDGIYLSHKLVVLIACTKTHVLGWYVAKGACQFFCVWGLEVGGDSVGVGGGELGEGLFPVGGGVSLDEAGVSCSFVGGFASVCEALGGAFVFDVADGEP